VGDEVEIRTKGKGDKSRNNVGGVISAVSDTFISVALFQDRRSTKQQQQQQQSNSSNNNKKKKDNDDGDDVDDETDVLNQAPLTLVPKSSIEVHKKMIAALQTLEKYGVDHPIAGPVIQAMFVEDKGASPKLIQSTNPQDPFNQNLDQSQLEAIAFALQTERPFSLIHGPPGTGKTTTVAELIKQAVYQHGMRVLVTAPSNVAVDNILERLVAADICPAKSSGGNRNNKHQMTADNKKLPPLRTVRLGHPARIKSTILSHSLEALVQSSEGTEIVHDVRNELQSFLKILSNPKSRGQDKRVAYREIKSLRKEVRVREEKVVQELITSAHVVLATTVGASNRILNKITNPRDGSTSSPGFDLVIIDEAAQALEASCWIPILKGKKVVLAGDHCQLPPTIKSKDRRAVVGLGNTMFERLMKLYSSDEKRISRMLKIQYRMNHNIADWASEAMYHGELLTHESVRDRTLRQLKSVQQKSAAVASSQTGNYEDDDEVKDTTLLLIDTAGCDMHEMATVAGSRFNEGEALVVSQHVRKLVELGVEQSEIAVITPYNGQCELLRSMLLGDFPKLEIRSVDGFQGGEREAVILSLVRSSDRGGQDGIGFLRDDRRQNVAVTRAKRHLAVVCDSETVSQSIFIHHLIAWIEKYGDQRSAIEYMSQSGNNKEYEEDLRKTEEDLMKLVESSFTPAPNKPSNESSKKGSKKDKQESTSSTVDNELEESKRKAWMDKISTFSESGKQGDEMTLNSELTSYDRRLVHEFAEDLGLGHRSEGVEGVNRRIILTIQKQKGIGQTLQEDNPGLSKEPDREENTEITGGTPVSNFAALCLEDSNSDDSDEDTTPVNQNESEKVTEVPAANSLLAQLAKERAARQQEEKMNPNDTNKVENSSKSKKNQKKKKSKGQKIGSPPEPPEEKLDDLDDMAFLDAQIDKAQNAHGRMVTGKGKNYRTIVNGILNARPEPQSKHTNNKANASLQAKLKQAEDARKKKSKKK
jgi:ATP-dependent RNA/DNA helicase IGHMBP2